ncbi:MAG TPA: preprotein translocase subunit YajC [Caulobacteraceae bacterium]|nr:preprotein translocase subunit YajC [Caulobacteraceae bacterium]
MFGTPAYAQTAASNVASNGLSDLLASPIPLVAFMGILFYFMLWRPQQQRVKQHQSMVSALKRGDTVVLNSGVIGKVAKVEDAELGVEIAPNVVIKVVRSMVSEVRAKGEPAPANDGKTS